MEVYKTRNILNNLDHILSWIAQFSQGQTHITEQLTSKY